MIQEEFVSFETAKLLKEAGFDIPCFTQYTERGTVWRCNDPENFNKSDNVYSRPTQALAARWIREVHKIHVGADMAYSKLVAGKWIYLIRFTDSIGNPYKCVGWFNDYEEALEAGLQEAIKLIKK